MQTKRLEDILAPVQGPLNEMETALSIEIPGGFSLLSSLREALARQRGKRLRPSLVFLSGSSVGEVSELHLRIAILTELIHAASLIHDDIIDGAQMRRGHPSLSRQWGSPIAVVFGDLLFSVSFRLTETLNDSSIRREIASATQDMCRGELLQHEFQSRKSLPTPDEYIEMVRLKTAAFLAACCRCGGMLSGAEPPQAEALARYGEHLGIAFQIVDDCLDLQGHEGKMGKSLGTDIATGKLTLPLLLLLHGPRSADRDRLAALMTDGSERDRAVVLPLLAAGGTVDAAYETAMRHVQAARKALAPLPAGPCRESLHELAEYVLSRDR